MRIILALTALLLLSGCQLATVAVGGAHVDNTVVFVEPGGVARVATDDKLKIVATDSTGKQVVTERNVAGFYLLPASVYEELAAEWKKNHPDKPAVKPVEPSKTAMLTAKDLPDLQTPVSAVANSLPPTGSKTAVPVALAEIVDAGNLRDEAQDIMAEKGLTESEYFGEKK